MIVTLLSITGGSRRSRACRRTVRPRGPTWRRNQTVVDDPWRAPAHGSAQTPDRILRPPLATIRLPRITLRAACRRCGCRGSAALLITQMPFWSMTAPGEVSSRMPSDRSSLPPDILARIERLRAVVQVDVQRPDASGAADLRERPARSSRAHADASAAPLPPGSCCG